MQEHDAGKFKSNDRVREGWGGGGGGSMGSDPWMMADAAWPHNA